VLHSVIAVHDADMIMRTRWELPLRSRSWMPCGIGQLVFRDIVVGADNSRELWLVFAVVFGRYQAFGDDEGM
jgi:hypothetical protein